VVLAMALAPLRPFGLRSVMVTTMQAVSGAGYPGVPSLDILGNLIPYIGGGEEDKIERETGKILGDGGAPHPATISAQVNRVPVIDGHTMTVSVALEQDVESEAAAQTIAAWRGELDGMDLPSAPVPPIVVWREDTRPQPRLDAGLGDGMTVSVGRVRRCPVLSHKLVALGHNTIRGAAGASVLNAEVMKAKGLL
jgi:aspartate-semialdehyde dehydrogenase